MNKKAAASEPDFEASLKELETLVEQLESGDLSLAESLKHFEKGVSLSRNCHAMIDQARQSVELLTNPEDPDSATEFTEHKPGAEESS
jgi:exodeoxyribonuclease VII small subunit